MIRYRWVWYFQILRKQTKLAIWPTSQVLKNEWTHCKLKNLCPSRNHLSFVGIREATLAKGWRCWQLVGRSNTGVKGLTHRKIYWIVFWTYLFHYDKQNILTVNALTYRYSFVTYSLIFHSVWGNLTLVGKEINVKCSTCSLITCSFIHTKTFHSKQYMISAKWTL